jgi:uncharacterized OB-fold protein
MSEPKAERGALNEQRPRPVPDRDSAPWWDAVRRHELLIQRCGGCGTPRFPPRAVCNRCRSREAEWVPSTGTGRVVSWIVNHQPFLPGMPGPYTVLFVRLDDGPDDGESDAGIHMYGNLIGADPADITPGMPVKAVFVDVDDDFTLVQWRPGH